MKKTTLLNRIMCLLVLLLNVTFLNAQTFNLQTITPSTIPSGFTLEWYRAKPFTAATLVTSITNVSAGVYYAVYKNASGCLSAPSPFKLVKTECPTNTTDLYASVDSTNKPSGTKVMFHTAKPVASSNVYNGNARMAPIGTYYVSYYDAAKDCYTLGSTIKVIPDLVCAAIPDINATLVNVTVPGNVSTNDHLPTGVSYGNPNSNPANPSPSTPTVNADGTYTFVSAVPGIYVFNVPICYADTSISCITQTLTITVTNPNVHSIPPAANGDIAKVDSGKSVNISVKGNDQPGTPTGSLGNPVVTTNPPHGTVTVNVDGSIKYTPDPGFKGVDTFVYSVCDTTLNPQLCDTATVIVYVTPPASNPGGSNSIVANDDYSTTKKNTPVSGNVKNNDIDPDGDPLTVAAQTTTVSGVGTLTLAADGNYTFTPEFGYTGPANFPYQVCDNQGNCTMATLYIVVYPGIAVNNDFNVTFVNVPVSADLSTNDPEAVGSSYGSPVALAGNPNSTLPIINPNGTYTFVTNLPGVYQFKVNVCGEGQASNCLSQLLTITVTNPLNAVSPPVANPDLATTTEATPVNITVKINDKATSAYGSLGDPSSLGTPQNGIASVNANGTIKYTPNPGFSGVDSFVYSVCDTALTPALCAETYVIVTVVPATSANTTFAADDYFSTTNKKPVTGNLLINDTDPQGHTQTVTPQTLTLPSGTLNIMADGTFTFTPVDTFIGTVTQVYTACDNGTPQACAKATLHITVSKAPDYTIGIFGDNLNFSNSDTTNDFVIGIQNINNTINKGALQFRMVQQLPNKIYTVDPNASVGNVQGGVPVQNNQWNITTQGSVILFTLKPGVVIPPNGVIFVAMSVTLRAATSLGSLNVSANIVNQSGGDSNSANNSTTARVVKQGQ